MRWAIYKGRTGVTDGHVLIYHIWMCFSPEIDTAATNARFCEDNGNLTESQFLAAMKKLVVWPPINKEKPKEALVKTPQARGKLSTYYYY